MAMRLEKFVEDKFSNLVSPKYDYAIPNCKDIRARQVLEFLVLILYLEKPTRVMVTLENTIFGALSGEREVEWAFVIRDTIKRLLAEVGKSKPMPICPYVLHLYHFHDSMLPEDKKAYMIVEFFIKHNVKLD